MNDTLIEAAKRDENKYTAESWAVFALAEAAVKNAMNGLQGGETTSPGQTDDSSESGKNNVTSDDSRGRYNISAGTPKTGDTGYAAGCAVIMVMAAGVIMVTRKKSVLYKNNINIIENRIAVTAVNRLSLSSTAEKVQPKGWAFSNIDGKP